MFNINMLLTINLNDVDINNILFNKSVNNNIIENSKFIKILYSNNIFSLNSIIIKLNFNFINKIEKFNKFNYIFDSTQNIDIISKLIDLEYQIINLYNNKNLIPVYYLKNYFLTKNNFHINYKRYNTNIYLKLTGIWKTNMNCGLIFKFM